MAGSTNALVWDVLARDKASKTFQNVGDSMEKAGHKGKAFGLVLGGAVGGALAALGAVVKTGYSELQEYQAGLAQSQAVIKSTGGAAGVTSKHVQDLASSIQSYSGQTDDSIVAGENLLLTFTDIRNEAGKGNDVFDQSTKILADMSQALGQDTKTSAIQLGKALNDPVKGITALQRVGVSFSESQIKTIKTLQATGHTMGAQKVILKELTKEFGGSAKAFGDSGPGQIARAKRAFEDLSQNIVQALLPTLTSVAGFLTNYVLPSMGRLGDFLGKTLSPIFTVVGKAVHDFFSGFQEGNVGETQMGAFGDATYNALQQVKVFIKFITDKVVPAFKSMSVFIESKVVPIFEKAFKIISTKVIPTFAEIAKFLMTKVVPAVFEIYKKVALNLKPAFEALAQFVMTRVIPAVQGLWVRFQQVLPTIEKVGMFVLKLVGFLLELVGKILGTVIPILFKLIGPVFTAWTAAIGVVIGAGVKLVGGMVSGFQSIGHAVSAMWDGVKAVFRFFVDSWMGVVGALVNGAASAFGWVPGIGGKLKDAAKQFNKFRDDVNRSLGGIQTSVHVNVSADLSLRQTDQTGRTIGGVTTVGNRASGGMVLGGAAYRINEQGPGEIFQPYVNGRILNRGQQMAAANAASGAPVHITVQGFVGSESQLAMKIKDMLLDLRRQRGSALGIG